MATPIEALSKVELRGVVRFLLANGKNPTERHKDIVATYGGNTMSKKQAYHWCTLY